MGTSHQRLRNMATPELLKSLCYDDTGELKPMDQCRAAMINHLILEQGEGVDEAEDAADKFIRESGIWPVPDFTWDEEDEEEDTMKNEKKS